MKADKVTQSEIFERTNGGVVVEEPYSETSPQKQTKTKKKQKTHPSKLTIYFLSYLAGISDVILFRRYAIFPTMMTGNLIKMLDAFITCNYNNVVFFAGCIIAYVIGSGGYARVERRRRYGKISTGRLLAPVVFFGFVAAEVSTWNDR